MRVLEMDKIPMKMVYPKFTDTFSVSNVNIFYLILARNPCGLYNGGCSHLCLLSSKYGYTCACPTGVNLLPDLQTCNTTSKSSFSIARSVFIHFYFSIVHFRQCSHVPDQF